MSKKRVALTILYALIALVVILCIVAWVHYGKTAPNMALYLAMAGGVFILNIVFAIFFVKRNFKGDA